jgi:hypothetical protein
MTSETHLNPPSVLPFEMFRTFLPISTTEPAASCRIASCEIHETDYECVLAINIPFFVDATKFSAEFKDHVLVVTLPKR